MSKKSYNPFRKPLIISLLRETDMPVAEVAKKARCSKSYVYQIRWEMDRLERLEQIQASFSFDKAEPDAAVFVAPQEPPAKKELPLWVSICGIIAAVAAIAAACYAVEFVAV